MLSSVHMNNSTIKKSRRLPRKIKRREPSHCSIVGFCATPRFEIYQKLNINYVFIFSAFIILSFCNGRYFTRKYYRKYYVPKRLHRHGSSCLNKFRRQVSKFRERKRRILVSIRATPAAITFRRNRYSERIDE